jgi:hypothetical protein
MSPRRCDLVWSGARGSVGEQFLAHNRLRVCVAALVLGAIAVGLAGCGRSGVPEPPPPGSGGLGWAFPPSFGAAPPVQPGDTAPNPSVAGANTTGQPTASKTGFDANGNPVAAAGQKKSFVLDPILQ